MVTCGYGLPHTSEHVQNMHLTPTTSHWLTQVRRPEQVPENGETYWLPGEGWVQRGVACYYGNVPRRIRGQGRVRAAVGVVISYISAHRGISKTMAFEERPYS